MPKKPYYDNYYFGKTHLIKYFTHNFYKESYKFLDDSEPIVFRSFPQMNLNLVDTDLSMGYIASLPRDARLFFGKPDNLLFLEDLVLKLDSKLLN